MGFPGPKDTGWIASYGLVNTGDNSCVYLCNCNSYGVYWRHVGLRFETSTGDVIIDHSQEILSGTKLKIDLKGPSLYSIGGIVQNTNGYGIQEIDITRRKPDKYRISGASVCIERDTGATVTVDPALRQY
ncbi:hypothetical protein KIPB_012401 [Kipferlia bialata]|uniref:Uncharacterized protein n=1 Tax=Kipferlia bialata TaxID=797122 RepID=A0A9K3GNV8_9EUKA|nr:hypothetical protein KIPB_012401 [Kipferlia bialata]|eukprot:g12401.t1